MNRRQLIVCAAAIPCLFAGRASAVGGVSAMSAPITGPVKLRMRATSISQGSHWGIFVQQVIIRDAAIVPVSLAACFEFGRKSDPFVYPELISAPLPLTTPPGDPYKVAVYFFENREPVLQPHSDTANLAIRFESDEDASGRTQRMYAASYDNALLPTAVIHEISIGFAYQA